MGCSGCGKARAEFAAKMNEQARIREQRLAQLPPDKKLTVMSSPVVQKTPRQLRIEARQIRMARRAARVARRIAAQKALEQPKL